MRAWRANGDVIALAGGCAASWRRGVGRVAA
jgi:hypothetical protein